MNAFADVPGDNVLLSWHIAAGKEVAAATTSLRNALRKIDDLLILPDELLHVSVFREGTYPDVSSDREQDVVERGRDQWTKEPPFAVEFGPVSCFPTAVVLEVHGPGPAALYRSISGAEAPAAFLAHLTLAVAATESPTAPIHELLAPLRDDRTTFGAQVVTELQLCRIRLGARNFLKPWDVVGAVTLGL